MPQIKLYAYEVESLPPVCMRCGAPCDDVVKKKFSWYPSWVWVLILANLIVVIIVASILTRRMTVLAPLCREHRNHWTLRSNMIVGGFFTIILAGAMGLLFGPNEFAGFLCLGMFGVLLLWVIVAIGSFETSIHPSEITDDGITLERVAPGFIDALEQQRESEPPVLRGIARAERASWAIPIALVLAFGCIIGLAGISVLGEKRTPVTAIDWNNQGLTHYHAGNYNQAIADFNQALQRDPNLTAAYHNRARTHFDQGAWDKAIADYGEVIRRQPASAEAYNLRGLALYGQGMFGKALDDFDVAIKLNATDGSLRANRALTYFYLEKDEEALADVQEALRLDARLANAYNCRGMIHDRRGEPDEAIVDYSEAIKLSPLDATLYANRGESHCRKKDFARSSADLNEALRLNPNLAIAYFYRSQMHAAMGDNDKAKADRDKAIQLDPRLKNSP